MSIPRRRRVAQVLALICAVAGLLVFGTAGVGYGAVAPVVDYSTYPPTLPAGCAEGAGALINVQFSAGGATSPSLRTLPLVPGQTFTMSWDGFSTNCAQVGVGLSSKIASLATFEQTADYWLYAFAYCGPEAGAIPCAQGANTLTLAVPPVDLVPCYQLDAHLTPPLAQVGPTTDYYSAPLNGIRGMLISAQNGGVGDCGPLPPCVTNPAIPAVAYLCPQTGTSTVPPTSAPPTTVPAVSTSAAASTTLPAPTTVAPTTSPPLVATSTAQPPCASGQVRDSVAGPCRDPLAGGGAQQLPVSGRDSRSLATTGVLFLLSGLCLVFAYRRSDGVASST